MMRVKFNLIQEFVSIKGGGPTFFPLLCIPTAYFTPGPSLLDGPALLQIRNKRCRFCIYWPNNFTVSCLKK